MGNKLGDLNDLLFEQLRRMSGETMTAEQIGQEVTRAEAIVAVGDQIIRNADLQLKAAKLFADHAPQVPGRRQGQHRPIQLGGDPLRPGAAPERAARARLRPGPGRAEADAILAVAKLEHAARQGRKR